MTRLTLHIGTTKTGTSSIQANLARHAALLAARGLIYPAAGRTGAAHHNLAYEISNTPKLRDSFNPARGGWDAALAEIGDRAGIISTEALSYLDPDAVSGLAARLADRDLHVVLYVRDQDTWLQSRMKQKAKFGRISLDANAYLDLNDEEHDSGYSRSKLLIWRNWADSFGADRITVVPFLPEVIGDDVTRHLLGLLEQPVDLFPDLIRRNESPSLRALIAVQVLMARCRADLGGDFRLGKQAAAKLSAFFADRPDIVDRYSLFSLSQGQAAIDMHAADTAELARRLRDPRLHVAAPRGGIYRHHITDPMALADQLTPEETAFIDRLATAIRRHAKPPASRVAKMEAPPALRAPSVAKFDIQGNLVVNHERWLTVADNPQRWLGRYREIATLLLAGERVIEFGCSAEVLRTVLPVGCHYQPADLVRRSDDCLVIDLTRESPASVGGQYDTAVYAGVLEYVPDPLRTLAETLDIAGRVIFSYATTDSFGDMEDRTRRAGWFSHLSEADLIAGAVPSGMRIMRAGAWKQHTIFIATRQAI